MRDSSRGGRRVGMDPRPFGRWGFATLALLGVAVAAACSAAKPTELVPGVLTQVQVPKDLRAIQVEVQSNGRVVFCQGYDVDQSGFVALPATLGVVSGTSAETTIKVTIRGYDDTGAATMNYLNCPDPTPAGPAPAPRVLRSSTQTFVDQHTLFLPMPLSYSCYDEDCSASNACASGDCVCKGAQCVDSATDARTLADFDPTLIDGQGICFSPLTCFGNATDAILVDPARCLYAAQPGLGINVRVFYEDITLTPGTTAGTFEAQVSNNGESEILDEDPQEGFCVGSCGPTGADAGPASSDASPDGGQAGQEAGAASGFQTFQLAPGLCGLVHAASSPSQLPTGGATSTYHAIGAVQVATDCPSKSPLLPICALERTNGAFFPDGAAPDGETSAVATSLIEETADGAAVTCGDTVPLASTPSVVYLIMDDSSVMSGAFGANGFATVMSLSLANPVFDTTYAAFRFFPESSNDAGNFDQSACTSAMTAFATPAVPFGVATQVQAQIANLLSTWTPPGDTPASPAPLDLQAALRPDAGAYVAVQSFLQGREAPNIAAVMAFVNRTPDPTNDCNPPLEGAADVKSAIEAEIQAAYSGSGIRTYFVVLANSSNSDGSSGVLDFYLGIQTDLPQMVTVIDATLPMTQAQQVLTNFAQGAEQLGTCLYEPIPGVNITALGYSDPFILQNLDPIPPNDNCAAATQTTVDGWGLDNGRFRVCGQSCTDIQNAILAAGALASESGIQSTVSVEGTVSCSGTAGP